MTIFNNIRMKDISLSEKTLLSQYKQLWQAQNWQGVADFLTAHPELRYKIFDAENWNRIANTTAPEDMIEIDYDYRNGDSSLNFDFVDDIDNNPENVSYNILKDAQDISESSMNFYYVGQWADSTTYTKNNLVTIDNYHLFYCIQTHTSSSSNKPTSTNGNQYWVLCKGFLGNLGNEGIIVAQTQPATLTNQDVWIEVVPEPATLMSGSLFNSTLVTLASVPSNINGIVFTNTLPQNSTSSSQYRTAIVSDSSSSEEITAYYNVYSRIVYVYCPNTIYANSNCSSMFDSFTYCSYFDFSNFNTSKITNMNSMFDNCTAIQNLNIGGFNTSLVTDMTNMFRSCTNLRGIYVDSLWTTENVVSGSGMFVGCTSLSGIGTDGRSWVYNASYTSYLYAQIGDSSSTQPAYLTQSLRVILFSSDGMIGAPTVTISQNGKTLLYSGAGYSSINIDPTKTVQIVAVPNDWDYMEIRNQGTVIYQQSFHYQNLNYTITAGTVFDELYFYSED